jgi:2-amino-4-hydroxy-6-hydroxymethyldihydropteridine diphosphokinase
VLAYLGLGSNVGDRLGNLRAARDALDGVERVVVVASSAVYETAAQGEVVDQADFLNACVSVETELSPLELLEACKLVEQMLGREEGGPRHGPRVVDVDVLLAGDVELSSDRLTLPHPSLTIRRFVLEPLLELNGDLRMPDGRALADAREAVADQRVERVADL